LIYLSGLTCTEDNFIHKAGAMKRAAELGLALLAPDTSPSMNFSSFFSLFFFEFSLMK